MNEKYRINFNEIIGVQQEKEKSYAIRIVYANTDENKSEDISTCPTLKLLVKEHNIIKSDYKQFESDVLKEIITKIDEIAKHRIDSNEKDFALNIMHLSNKIAITTRRGPGNFAIFSEDLYKKFVSIHSSAIIQSNIKIFASPYLNQKVIIGYKGPGKSDTGLVLNMSKDNSQYQLINIEGAEKYYAVLEVK